ncbi:MAG: hypothetical protein ACR2H5_13620 [Ktedonobacteraceae bacterium]
MFLQRKLRFSAMLMIVGSILAALGEIVNALTTDVLSSLWYPSLGLIVVGTLILLIGLSTFASVSDQVNGFGFVGSNLLLLGGFFLIIATVALDWILVPFLSNLANTIASTINGPATTTQDQLNKIISSLNGLGGSFLQSLFPGAVPHIPSAHIPMANGIALVNKALIQLHIPTIDKLAWWGHFSLSGGSLTIGSGILGLALPRRDGKLTPPGALLIVFTLLNVLCQFFTSIPSFFGNITAVVLFLTLGWLGVSAWSSKRTDVASSKGVERDTGLPSDETLMIEEPNSS